MELKDLIISTLVVGILTTSFLFVNMSMAQRYGNDPSGEYAFIWNATNDTTSLYNDVEGGAITNSSISEANPIGFYLFSGQMWAALKLMIKSPGIVFMLISTVLNSLGVPPMVMTFLAIILGVTVLFMLVWLFWRYRQ